MGNVLDSFFTGFSNSIGNFFGSPLDFLSGKSWSSVCPSPRDVICYVENFRVANLAKAALILIVSYFLFFIYMLYKVGFWYCIVHGFCRLLWAFVSCWFYVLSYYCSFFCLICYILNVEEDISTAYAEDYYDDDSGGNDDDRSFTNYSSRQECRKEERRSHRVRVGVGKDHPSDLDLSQQTGGGSSVHGIKVSRVSVRTEGIKT